MSVGNTNKDALIFYRGSDLKFLSIYMRMNLSLSRFNLEVQPFPGKKHSGEQMVPDVEEDIRDLLQWTEVIH